MGARTSLSQIFEIMNKEEAIEIIKRNCPEGSKLLEACMVFVPELRESEDERMKRAIVHILYENYSDAAVIEGVEIAEIVAWLDKQKEQKPAEWSEEDEWFLHNAVRIVACDLGEDSGTVRWLKALPGWINPQPKQEQSGVAGVVHHALNTHWVVTDKERVATVLKAFPEGAKVKMIIVGEEEK